MKWLALLPSLALSCAVAVPGGWVGPTPTLWVTPEAHEHSPLFTDALLRMAREYCRRGYRCVDIEIGHGANEVRVARNVQALGGSPGGGKPKLDSVLITRQKAAKRIVYVLREDPRGRPIVLVPDDECDARRNRFSATLAAQHELGHFLGYGHSGNPRDIMFPELRCGLKDPRWP